MVNVTKRKLSGKVCDEAGSTPKMDSSGDITGGARASVKM
jgi:hypothetical protein